MIYILFGPGGSGKSTLADYICHGDWAGKHPMRIKQYTTRPPRKVKLYQYGGEFAGDVANKSYGEYVYISDDLFDEENRSGQYIEASEYVQKDGSVWKYGTDRRTFNMTAAQDYVLVTNSSGVSQIVEKLSKEERKDIVVVLLWADEMTRVRRMVARGDSIDKIEARLRNDFDWYESRYFMESDNIRFLTVLSSRLPDEECARKLNKEVDLVLDTESGLSIEDLWKVIKRFGETRNYKERCYIRNQFLPDKLMRLFMRDSLYVLEHDPELDICD